MIVLENPYPYEQLWFDFCVDTYFPIIDYQNEYVCEGGISLGATNMSWSHEEVATTQYVLCLPSRGARPSSKRVTNRQFRALAEHDYPTFDKDGKGEVLQLRIRRFAAPTMRWVDDNCRNRYHQRGNFVVFETRYDYVHAMLSGNFLTE